MKDVEERGWKVLCMDESIFLYDSVIRHLWVKKGSKPIVLTTGSHRRTCLFGSLSLEGKQLFRQYDTANGKNFITYMKTLKRKFGSFLLFMDRAPHHRSNYVQRWLRKNRKHIKVKWFPTARPELNPLEECWRQSKNIIQANHIHPTFETMKKEISKTMRTKRFKLNMVKYLC